MRLKDRVTIITGGGRGIGKASVYKFCYEGAKVIICDVTYDDCNNIVEVLSFNEYNIFNWTNFDRYVGKMNLPTFGRPTAAGEPQDKLNLIQNLASNYFLSSGSMT